MVSLTYLGDWESVAPDGASIKNMGAHRASELHRANRITELRSGAQHSLDTAFTIERAPYCGTYF